MAAPAPPFVRAHHPAPSLRTTARDRHPTELAVSAPRIDPVGPDLAVDQLWPAQTPGSRRRHGLGQGRVLAPLLLAAVLLLLWEVATRAGAVDTFFLPAPSEIAARVWTDLTGPALAYAQPTLTAAVAGSLLAVVVAVPLGVLVASSSLARTALEPYIAASQALPAVAVAPLLVLWLGYGLLPVAVLCALMVFFPILVSTVHGLSNIDIDVVHAARIDGAGGLTLLRTILLPLALPSMLAGVRTGFTISITGAIVGEIVTGGDGMGLLLSTRAASADTIGLFSVLVMLCAVAVAVYVAIGALQRRLAAR